MSRFPQECGGMGIRTPGLVIANDALYELSLSFELFLPQRLMVENSGPVSIWGPPVLPP
jgi:hypothetical protein